MQPERQPKESTLQLRLSPYEKEILNLASKVRHMSLSCFVLDNAYTAAQEVLGSQNHFMLSPEQWDLFTKALDAPVREIHSLKQLLNTRDILDEE